MDYFQNASCTIGGYLIGISIALGIFGYDLNKVVYITILGSLLVTFGLFEWRKNEMTHNQLIKYLENEVSNLIPFPKYQVWIYYLFDKYRWFRRWKGGHWEHWWNDLTHSKMWFHCSQCSLINKNRPPCCFGTPICEQYNERFRERT